MTSIYATTNEEAEEAYEEEKEDRYDIVIVGGGVVGCAVLRAATLQGWKCALLESESHLLSHASGSNSGIACTGVDASPYTLERALIRDSNSLFRIYCKEHNIPIRPCGSIVCLWPWDDDGNNDDGNNDDGNNDDGNNDDGNNDDGNNHDKGENKKENDHDNESPLKYIDHDSLRQLLLKQRQNEKLSKVYNESYDANDTHVQQLSKSQIHSMEPNLSSNVQGGVHIPGEIVVDPWLYSISLAVHARENGAVIYTDCRFDTEDSKFDEESGMWNVVVVATAATAATAATTCTTKKKKKKMIRAKAIVNAAGLWSDTVQKQTLKNNHKKHSSSAKSSSSSSSSSSSWTAKPRRGQYRIYKSNPQTSIQHPIQPIPTQRTKGIFVFSSSYNHIVVGPTALDQESKTDKSIDPMVAQELDNCVKRIIPNIDVKNDCIGEYVGIRPGTDKRDYQIHLFPKKHWVAVAGIRSTGLTASLGIGNYVVRNLRVILDHCCNDDDDDDDDDHCDEEDFVVSTTPLPSTQTLIQEYKERGDGMVTIHGHEYKVTHPLTQLGWGSSS